MKLTPFVTPIEVIATLLELGEFLGKLWPEAEVKVLEAAGTLTTLFIKLPMTTSFPADVGCFV